MQGTGRGTCHLWRCKRITSGRSDRPQLLLSLTYLPEAFAGQSRSIRGTLRQPVSYESLVRPDDKVYQKTMLCVDLSRSIGLDESQHACSVCSCCHSRALDWGNKGRKLEVVRMPIYCQPVSASAFCHQAIIEANRDHVCRSQVRLHLYQYPTRNCPVPFKVLRQPPR
jgi:hypothetical protein